MLDVGHLLADGEKYGKTENAMRNRGIVKISTKMVKADLGESIGIAKSFSTTEDAEVAEKAERNRHCLLCSLSILSSFFCALRDLRG